MRLTLLIVTLLLIVASNLNAACEASFSSSPDDPFGQLFDCDDGSTVTYKRGVISDSIEHRDNQTGQTETY